MNIVHLIRVFRIGLYTFLVFSMLRTSEKYHEGLTKVAIARFSPYTSSKSVRIK